MTYEVRQATGTHALKCDTEGCHMELLAPSEVDLLADAGALGWQANQPNHTCASCLRGVNAGAGAVQSILNSMGARGSVVQLVAPGPVSKGDPAYQEHRGQMVEVGHYLADAGQLDRVAVQLKMPTAAQSVAVSPQLAAILAARQSHDQPSNPPGYTQAGGPPPAMDEDEAQYQASMQAFSRQVEANQRQASPSKEPGPWDDILNDDAEERPEPSLDDLFGKAGASTLPAPSAGPALTGDWKDRMASVPGTAGGAGLVKGPPTLDPKKVAKARDRAPQAPRPPQVDAEKLVAANDLFGFLTKNGWTPDDK